MKKITMLRMQGCPYCAQADRAISETKRQRPIFADVQIEMIDTRLQPTQAAKYKDKYYYVPTMFVDDEKIYEAHPGESYSECYMHIQKVFEAAE